MKRASERSRRLRAEECGEIEAFRVEESDFGVSTSATNI